MASVQLQRTLKNPKEEDSDDEKAFERALQLVDPSIDDNDRFKDIVAGEDIVMDAAKHVEMARKQRELFILKKEQAIADRDKPYHERTYTRMGKKLSHPGLCALVRLRGTEPT